MNYKKMVVDALTPVCSPLGISPMFGTYNGSVFPYITFILYDAQGEAWAENEEIETGYYIQVDIWSKDSDYDDLASKVRSAMLAAGFLGGHGPDIYEQDTKIYHKPLRFIYC